MANIGDRDISPLIAVRAPEGAVCFHRDLILVHGAELGAVAVAVGLAVQCLLSLDAHLTLAPLVTTGQGSQRRLEASRVAALLNISVADVVEALTRLEACGMLYAS